jgi:hypothetical protein
VRLELPHQSLEITAPLGYFERLLYTRCAVEHNFSRNEEDLRLRDFTKNVVSLDGEIKLGFKCGGEID